jgi:carbon storage regulator
VNRQTALFVNIKRPADPPKTRFRQGGQKELEMLVLSRQKDESIMIGDNVEITIVDVRGDKVRLGIAAPKDIPVHRKEVYEAIQREKNEQKKSEKQ